MAIAPARPDHGRDRVADARAAMRRRVVPVVVATVFLDLVGFGIILPLLPLYVGAFGGSAQMVGALLATFSVCQLLATPMLGRLSDRIGRRPVIALSLVGNVVSMLLFALATIRGWLPVLFCSRALAGATAGNLASCQAAIADVTDDDERSRSMGLIGAGIGLGMLLGPAIGGVLSVAGAWAPPLGAAVLAFADLLAALLLLPETVQLRRGVREVEDRPRPHGPVTLSRLLRDPPTAAVLVVSFLTFVCMTNVHATMPLLAAQRFGWDGRHVGWMFTLIGVGSLVVQSTLIAPLVRRFGAPNVARAGLVFLLVAMLLIAGAAQPDMLAAGALCVGVGAGLVLPSLATTAADLAHPSERGAVLGYAQSSGGLGRAVGPLCAGALFTYLGAAMPFLAGSITAAVAFAVGMLLFRPSSRSRPAAR